MKMDQLPKVKAKVAECLTITEDNFTKKSLNSPYMYHQWLDLLMDETLVLKKLAIDRDKMYGELYEHYKFNHIQTLDSKGEIEAWIKKDPKYIKLNTEFVEQEVICKYLEGVVDRISKLSFDLKNFVEYKKFLSGS